MNRIVKTALFGILAVSFLGVMGSCKGRSTGGMTRKAIEPETRHVEEEKLEEEPLCKEYVAEIE